jgi:hypothetical protein
MWRAEASTVPIRDLSDLFWQLHAQRGKPLAAALAVNPKVRAQSSSSRAAARRGRH